MLAAAVAERQQALFEVRRTAAMLRSREASLANAQRIAQLGNWDLNCTAVTATDNCQESAEHHISNIELRWSNELYRLLGLAPTVKPTPSVFFSRISERPRIGGAIAPPSYVGAPNPIVLTTELCWQTAPNALSANSRQFSQGRSPTVQDVTERHRAEVAWRASSDHDRLLSEMACQFATPLNIEEILNNTVAEVRQFFKADRAFIGIMDAAGYIFLVRCTVRLWPNLWEANAVLFSGGPR